MIQNLKKVTLLILIVLLAFILRFYQLGQNPPSLDWDESSIGYNAFSILNTGSDEYGDKLPLSIRSFNDFKPPLYIYSVVPAIKLFGLSEWSVRLPSALAGVLAVVATYFLAQQITRGKLQIALVASLLLAVSPWHIQLSRVAFESNLALFCFVAGGAFLFQGLNRGKFASYLFSSLFFILSIYSYHSARLVIPVFVLVVAVLKHRTLINDWKKLVPVLALSFVLLTPLVLSLIRSTGQARFNSVSIFSASGLHDVARTKLQSDQQGRIEDMNVGDRLGASAHNKYLTYAQLFAKNYLDHFNFDFLFLSGDHNPRHHAPDVGQMLIVEFPLFLLGVFLLLSKKPPFGPFVFAWLLTTPIASALTTETPHAVRAALMLPSFQLIVAFALVSFQKYLRKFSKAGIAVVSMIIALNFFYFAHQYFIHMQVEYASSWQYGYKQVVNKVIANYNSYDQIYVTKAYDQPYIYFLFYGNADPEIKNDGSFESGFGKIHFVNWPETDKDPQKFKNQLIVTAPSDRLKPERMIEEIRYPGGATAFYIGVGL